jgi:cobalt transporter subunit CbtA
MPLSLTEQFRRVTLVVLVSGTLAGLALFVLQQIAVIPLIEMAETYETGHHPPGFVHEDEGWQPENGAERTVITALGTILTGIAFAALLFGGAGLAEAPLNASVGALWGLAGFASFALAPALGLPPAPPGVAAADLSVRQLWWIGTVTATAIGLWLLFGRRERPWALRSVGLICLAVPHVIGAPAATGSTIVPIDLVHRFAVRSVASSAVFWLLLGTLGGFLVEWYIQEPSRSSH